jgi:hypothetical protein
MNNETPIIRLAVYLQGGKVIDVASNSSQPVRVAVVDLDAAGLQETKRLCDGVPFDGHIQPAHHDGEVDMLFSLIGDAQLQPMQPTAPSPLLGQANELLAQVRAFGNSLSGGQSAEKRYLEGSGNHCPICGGNDIGQDGDVQTDGSVAFVGVVCQQCGASWVDHYRLSGYGSLTANEGWTAQANQP